MMPRLRPRTTLPIRIHTMAGASADIAAPTANKTVAAPIAVPKPSRTMSPGPIASTTIDESVAAASVAP